MFQLMHKDSGEGIVCEFRGGEVLLVPVAVGIKPLPAPPRKRCASNGCGSCDGCTALASIPNSYARVFSVPVDDTTGYKIGDRVKYVRFIPEPNLMSTLIFGVPVAFAMVSILCLHVVGKRSIESPFAVLCAAVAFFTGMLVIWVVNNALKKKYPSAILSLIDPQLYPPHRAREVGKARPQTPPPQLSPSNVFPPDKPTDLA